MRNIKAVLILLMALVAGLAAAVFATGWASQASKVAVRPVVVAATDIHLGSKLNPQMLQVVDWPAASVPAGAFDDMKQLQDRVVRSGIARGEALLDKRLMPPGAQGGLSAVIAEGKRAMTVRVNDVVGVAGFALPGNYVDVMVNAQQDRAQGDRPIAVSMTVLEHVLVLAVAQEAGRDETKPKVVNAVTLELSPEDAEKLDLARSVGTLSLVLRNQLDQQRVATRGITKETLFKMLATGPAPAPAPEAKPAPVRVAARPRSDTPAASPARSDCVEVIRNGMRTSSCF